MPGGFIFKCDDSTFIFNDLIFDDGGRIWGGNTGGNTGTIVKGNITVLIPTGTNNPTIFANQSSYTFQSYITGPGDLTLAGGSEIWMSNTNALDGDIIVSEGTKTFTSNSLSIFVIGADGENNAITGSGAVFNGTFEFDLSGAGTTIGDSWSIATEGAAFGTNFVVSGFQDNEDGTWYLDGTDKYKFYEETGTLLCVSGNIYPISVESETPGDGRATADTQPEISLTVRDGSDDSVLGDSVDMTVAGVSVTPVVTSPSSGTTLISYTPASPLEVGEVDVVVTYDDDSAVSYTNSWTFTVHPTTENTLWNINIAGNIGDTQINVTNGVIVMAPANGDNEWNNVAGENGLDNVFTVYDSNGGNSIGYETSGSHNWGVSLDLVFPNLFYGWCGANAPMNMTNVLTGLDADNAYDIYVYSTWRWTQNTVDYEIIEGYADVTSASVSEVQGNVQNDAYDDYSDCVYGENYIIFENVTPTAEGRIAFTGVCSDGILSGLQVLEVPGGGSIPDIEVGATDPVDGATGVSTAPTLKAYFDDVAGTVNSSSISMTIDGVSVTPTYAYDDPTSTISYTVTTPFENSSVHTAKVVVAGSLSGSTFTSEWSFTTAGSIVYVDAEAGNGSNTMEWGGADWVEFIPPQNLDDGGEDNLWEEEWGTPSNIYGNGPSTSNSWFEAGREGSEDAPQLRTQAAGLENGTYEVYAYFWWADGANQTYYLGAALTNNPTGGLPLYSVDVDAVASAGVALASATDFSTEVVVTSSDRKLYQISLGTVEVSDGVLTVYIDDVGDASNVWYDGIGYEPATGSSLQPDIQSISVADGTVTLRWTSENGATYSIMQKSSLGGSWTAVKTGISGSDSSTTDSVDVSGDDQEFFQIQGE